MRPRSAVFDGRLPVAEEGYAWADGWYDARVLADLIPAYTFGDADQAPSPTALPRPRRGLPVRVLVPRRTTDGSPSRGTVVDVLASADLHRQLAGLPTGEAHLLEFADRFGSLSGMPARGAEPAWALASDAETLVAAEPWTAWTREIGRMRVLCAFWDGHIDQAIRQMDDLEPPNHPPSLADLLAPQRTRLRDAWLGYADRIERSPRTAGAEAREFVTARIDAELSGTHLHLAAGPDGLHVRPGSLLAAAYLSFALEVAAAQGMRACQTCGRALIDAERSTRRYCDGRCKNRAQRARSRRIQTEAPLASTVSTLEGPSDA